MDPQNEKYQPVNSFTRTPNLTQVVGYILIVSLFIVFFAAVQGNYQSQTTRLVIILLFLLDLCVLLISTLISSKTDPVDPVLLIYRNGNREQVMPLIDKCLFCDTCRSYVKDTSRHCKVCNRCVDCFDHHCGWINNCIGKQNYTAFFIMITSALLYLLIFCMAVGLLWREQLWEGYYAAIIADWVFFTIALFVSVMLTLLIILHVYLFARGLTTFQLIMERRSSLAVKEEAERSKREGGGGVQKHNTTDEIMGGEPVSEANLAIEKTKNTVEEIPMSTMSTQKRDQIGPGEGGHTLKRQVIKNSMQEVENIPTDNSVQLKELFRRNKSLKFLVGNDVLVRSNHNMQSFEREYHTIRVHRKNTEQSRKVENMGILNYVSHQGNRRRRPDPLN